MSLEEYRRKRDFEKTPEPKAERPSGGGRRYVIQKHAARRLHYDFRIELNGALLSWALPKGPSLDPGIKRLAVQVEDHPIAYGRFEGIIPKGEYGAGTVMLWDQGEWEPVGDPEEGLRRGELKFKLHGQRLKGGWVLVRTESKPGDAAGQKQSNWLLIKHRDAHADDRPPDVVEHYTRSVSTGRTMEAVTREKARQWRRGGKQKKPTDDGKTPIDLSGLPGARKAELPAVLLPQLAILASSPPEGDEWLHEIKYDGYRLICVLDHGKVKLISRNGHDWTDRFEAVAAEVAGLPASRAILDGEMVVLRRNGTTDFQALQNYFRNRARADLAYILFDLPFLENFDLTAVALTQRKQILEQLLGSDRKGVLRFGGQISGRGGEVFRQACRLGAEGIVSKKRDAAYEQRRARTWIKTKCRLRQEFVIGGYAVTDKAAGGMRSLLVGYYDPDGGLVYAGRVGTGFSNRQRESLVRQLEDRRREKPAFGNPPRGRGFIWVDPDMVAEVAFAQWTNEGLLRQAAFQGLREDKPARDVTLESKAGPLTPSGQNPATNPPSGRKRQGRIPLTNASRVLYPQPGITKSDILRYYETAADRILPHIVERPLTLVRCPEGIESACFYQKHVTQSLPPALETVSIREKKGKQPYLYIRDFEGLAALVQISALELHPWGSRVDNPELPDTVIFDLDPDPDLAWEHVIHAAWHLRGILEGQGLTSFVKTSGGKGLHIQLPIRRGPDWETVKDFAGGIAREMAALQPERYTASPLKKNRTGKIFIDYLRNGRGATSVAPYSLRARPGAVISMPLDWLELSRHLRPDAYGLQRLPDGFGASGWKDPWKGYSRADNVITGRNR